MIFVLCFLLTFFSLTECFGAYVKLQDFKQSSSEYDSNLMLFQKSLSKANFHTVEKGKLYRSGQMPSSLLKKCFEVYKIKTVINFRRKKENHQEFVDEKKACEEHKVVFINLPMDSESLTSKETLIKLLGIYDTAEYPMLIHCKVGRDRTGEAATIYAREIMQQDPEIARKQLCCTREGKAEPAKFFLMKIWGGREWLENEYNQQGAERDFGE